MTHEPQQRAEALAVDARGAAKLLGIGARTVADLAARGELPFVRIGRRVVYPTHLLRKWLDLRRRAVLLLPPRDPPARPVRLPDVRAGHSTERHHDRRRQAR